VFDGTIRDNLKLADPAASGPELPTARVELTGAESRDALL
jgi:ABC-type transport system involved in cytochrome bd biosynthesis fused ATPase/permease subunit